MGTNYYVHTPTCANACEHCAAGQQIHLGKSSVGWRFCFQAEPEWPREQAYSLWLERAKTGEIRDEGGETLTLDELLAHVKAKQDEQSHVAYISPTWGRSDADFYSEGYDFCGREFS